VRFELLQAVNGVAFCRGPNINPPAPRLCVGLPRVDDENLFPLQGYTEFAAWSLDAPEVQPPAQTADAQEAIECGWDRLANGELIAAAEAGGFHARSNEA
jgi:hypothetical protein